MKKQVQIRSIRKLFPIAEYANDIREKINCIFLDDEGTKSRLTEATFLNASIAILVLSGNGQTNINYKSYPVATNTVLLLSASHLFSFDQCSPDFKCVCLLVSKEFMEEMDSTDMIYRRIKYGVKLYNTPVILLDTKQISLLHERIVLIDKAIGNPEHLYYKDLILNCLFAFYLDLSNIIDRQHDFQHDGTLTRYESIIHSFIELLINNYREEHKVEFYSSRLNISTHYLTLIVKRITGQSVCDFIFEMLYSEARNLLVHSKLSIQEITTRLYFSDQSSFGKFFKRKSGLSPHDYRKNQG